MDDDFDFDKRFNQVQLLAGCGGFISLLLSVTFLVFVIWGIVWLVNMPAIQKLLGY